MESGSRVKKEKESDSQSCASAALSLPASTGPKKPGFMRVLVGSTDKDKQKKRTKNTFSPVVKLVHVLMIAFYKRGREDVSFFARCGYAALWVHVCKGKMKGVGYVKLK